MKRALNSALVRGVDGLIRWSEEALDFLTDTELSVEKRVGLCVSVLEDRGFVCLGGGVYILGDHVIIKVVRGGVLVNDLKRGLTVLDFELEDRESWSGLWGSIRLAWVGGC